MKIQQFTTFFIRLFCGLLLIALFSFAALLISFAIWHLTPWQIILGILSCMLILSILRLVRWAYATPPDPQPEPNETEPRYQGPWLI